MSCSHGNPISGCDTCDEVDAAFEAGKRSALAEQPASKPWVRLTDDDKCVKELYESDTDPEWIDGYTAGLKDAENKLRRYNAQPALVVEQLNPVAEVKLKQQGGNAGFATVINEMYEIIEMLCLDAEAAHGIKENT